MPGGFHPPPEIIAQWPTPNYENPEHRGKTVLVISIIFPALCLIVVCLRLYTRIWIKKAPGLDDVLITLAVIPAMAIAVLCILPETQFAWYRHAWDIPRNELVERRLHSWMIELLFVFSTGLGKMSVLVLYRRVIKGIAKPLFIGVVNGMIVGLVAYTLAYIILTLLQCQPTEAYWLQWDYPPGEYPGNYSCIPEGPAPFSNAIVSVITDFIVAIVPTFLFWQLQMPCRERVGLSILFGVGLVVCVVGIIRTLTTHAILFKTYDITWRSYDLWVWVEVEINLMIICASVPPLNGFFQHICGVRIPSTSSNSRGLSSGSPDDDLRGQSSSGGYTSIKGQRGARDPYALDETLSLDSNPLHRRSRLNVLSSVRHSLVGGLNRSGTMKILPGIPDTSQGFNHDSKGDSNIYDDKHLVKVV